MLRRSMAVFDALDYLSSPPEVPQPLTAANITPQTRIQARVVLRDIRHVVNEYRDDRRVGLVRTRNNLLWTGTVTGLVGFLLLALAILREVEETAVVAAMVFFLVGATVGLFNQLSSGWGNPEGEQPRKTMVWPGLACSIRHCCRGWQRSVVS